MAELPILPLKVASLLSDTTHMSAEEFGGYCHILFAMWLNGGQLQESDLQKISRISQYKWRKVRERILRPLTIIEGTVSQKRLTDTWLRVLENRRKATEAINYRWERERAIRSNIRTNIRPKYERNTTEIRKKEREEAGATEEASKGNGGDLKPTPELEALVASMGRRRPYS